MSVFELERDGDIEGLIEVLEQSSNASVRGRAASALGGFDSELESILDPLIHAANGDSDESVRSNAIDALHELGPEAIETLLRVRASGTGQTTSDLKSLINHLRSDSPEIRMAAAAAIGKEGDRRAVPYLTKSIKDPNPRVRARAVSALAMLGDPRGLPAITAVRTDDSRAVRTAIASALGEFDSPDAIEVLSEMITDPVNAVRREAVTALGTFDDLDTVDPLVSVLTDDSEVVRQAAVYSIIEILSNVSTDQSHATRERVVDVINKQNDPQIIEPLIQILEQSSQLRPRRNTAWLIGRIDHDQHIDRVIEGLVDALVDEDDLTSQFAATGLIQIGGKGVETRLIDELDRADPAGRAKIVYTLGKVGGEQAKRRIDKLIEETESDEVRNRAFSAYSRLGGVDQ